MPTPDAPAPLSPFRLVYIFCRALGLSLMIQTGFYALTFLASFLGLMSGGGWAGSLMYLIVGLVLSACAPGIGALLTGQNSLRGDAIASDLGRDLYSRRLTRLWAGVLVLVTGLLWFSNYAFYFVYYRLFQNHTAIKDFYSLSQLIVPFLQISLALFLIHSSGFPRGQFSEAVELDN